MVGLRPAREPGNRNTQQRLGHVERDLVAARRRQPVRRLSGRRELHHEHFQHGPIHSLSNRADYHIHGAKSYLRRCSVHSRGNIELIRSHYLFRRLRPRYDLRLCRYAHRSRVCDTTCEPDRRRRLCLRNEHGHLHRQQGPSGSGSSRVSKPSVVSECCNLHCHSFFFTDDSNGFCDLL